MLIILYNFQDKEDNFLAKLKHFQFSRAYQHKGTTNEAEQKETAKRKQTTPIATKRIEQRSKKTANSMIGKFTTIVLQIFVNSCKQVFINKKYNFANFSRFPSLIVYVLSVFSFIFSWLSPSLFGWNRVAFRMCIYLKYIYLKFIYLKLTAFCWDISVWQFHYLRKRNSLARKT